jgi:hypothetical protein
VVERTFDDIIAECAVHMLNFESGLVAFHPGGEPQNREERCLARPKNPAIVFHIAGHVILSETI